MKMYRKENKMKHHFGSSKIKLKRNKRKQNEVRQGQNLTQNDKSSLQECPELNIICQNYNHKKRTYNSLVDSDRI